MIWRRRLCKAEVACAGSRRGEVVMPQHFGVMDSVPDFRMTTRSIKLNPFTSFLYWRMNWHA